MSHVKIIEEVPGVPSEEQYYVTGDGLPKYPNHLHFATAADARAWCESNGHTHELQPFEP